MWETWVQSLGREDPLEKEMVTHSSILAWRIPWTEKPGRLQSMGRKESDTSEWLHPSPYGDIPIFKKALQVILTVSQLASNAFLPPLHLANSSNYDEFPISRPSPAFP